LSTPLTDGYSPSPRVSIIKPEFVGYETARTMINRNGVRLRKRGALEMEEVQAVPIFTHFSVGLVAGAAQGPSGEPGDWIARDCATGHLGIISRHVVEAGYVEIIGSEGTCLG
jgi:hypothetical protein